MIIQLNREIISLKSTIGTLQCESLQCETLEDPPHKVKVYGNTCIPVGQYQIKLRTEGGKHQKYLQRFGPDFHKGMLWLQDVPNFEYIYIHIGNSAADTLGCILIGTSHRDDCLMESETAYKLLYPKLANAILSGEDVSIDIVDRSK